MGNKVIAKKIDVGLEKVDRIYHIADIHFRNVKRHKEYRKVLGKFYDKVESTGTENSLIFIAGDVAHAKVEMSPELVREISEFLLSCAGICPTVVIAGNHDANLSNLHRLDVLSPIIDALDNEQIIYLRKTGLYRIADCFISVMGIFESPDDYIRAESIKGPGLKIAVHHGAINRAVTDLGYVITTGDVSMNMFDGYDIVLCGDIHKAQTLQEFHCEISEVSEDDLQNYLQEGWEIVETIDNKG